MTTIFQALTAVMNDVQGVRKGERNTAQGGGYLFRGIDAVTNAVGPALRKHGVIVAPRVLESHYGTVTVGQKRTEMSHARLLIEFTWYGPDGDSIVSVTAGESFDSGDKATAKAHSVAFRTAMIQTLCLPTDEPDPDEQTYQRAAPSEPVQAGKAMDELLDTVALIDEESALQELWRTHNPRLSPDDRKTFTDMVKARKKQLDELKMPAQNGAPVGGSA